MTTMLVFVFCCKSNKIAPVLHVNEHIKLLLLSVVIVLNLLLVVTIQVGNKFQVLRLVERI